MHQNFNIMQSFTQIFKASSIRNNVNVSTRRYVTNKVSKEKTKYPSNLNCINQVTLLGRAINFPKRSDTNPVIVHFALATYDIHKYITGEVYKEIHWHKICVHDRLLQESVINTIRRGQRVYVTGTLGIAHIETHDGLVTNSIVIDAEKIVCIKTNDMRKISRILKNYKIDLEKTGSILQDGEHCLEKNECEKSEKEWF